MSLPEAGESVPSDVSVTVRDGPCQPKLRIYPMTVVGGVKRSLISSWYVRYPYLEYSCHKDALLCFVCRHFAHCTQYIDKAFTVRGYKDWKHMSDKLAKHDSSKTHKEAFQQ